jgi:endoglucanase
VVNVPMPQQKIFRQLSLAAIAGFCLFAASLLAAKPAAAIDAAIQAQQMAGGLNVLGYDPIWSNPDKAHFKEHHFAAIRAAGFKTLRLNLQAFPHMNARNELDPQWLKTLDWVVSEATGQAMVVIIDEHDYESCAQDAIQCRIKLTAFWQQIAHHFRDAPDSVLFELLNEPNGQLTPVLWNAYALKLLSVVRQENPTRNVIIGPAFSNSFRHLQELSLPAQDRHIIVTIHYYEPITFTHQGAPWVPGGAPPTGVTWGSETDRQTLATNFETVQKWSKANNRPIFLGEFGVYEKADLKSRVAYITAVARAAEARSWSWAYWQFDNNFAVYDMKTDHWIQPILDALHPPTE